MELVHVEINNYRSIEKQEFDLEKETKVFIGVSETGKSNLLKALNTINSQYVFDSKDIRENIDNANFYGVKYTTKLSIKEKQEIVNILKEKFPYINLDTIVLSNDNNKPIPLIELFNEYCYYNTDIDNQTKVIKSIFQRNNYILNPNIKFIALNSGETELLTRSSDNYQLSLNEANFIDEDSYKIQNTEKRVNVSLDDFFSKLEDNVSSIILEKFNVNVLYWTFSSDNLLPAEIKTQEFINNPNICLPLKKIFELAGKGDISKEYEKCQQRRRKSAWKNLLNDVNKKINSYIKGKWASIPDNTKIILDENGDYITIEIKDSKNGYEMMDRSDGYKRLMTFLIMVSIDNKLSKLNNALILIDSPDLEIDIPSQKYLKNELIEIGKNNYVFYSTHSPYMIDNDNIGRHYIVSKKNEITKIEQAEEAKAYDNIIMLNALGTSLFEDVNNINIAFEGFTDKILFDNGKKFLSSKDSIKFIQVGRCQFSGLKNLNSFVGIWELICKVKKCIVCIDNDDSAKEKLKSYNTNYLTDVCDIITYDKYITSRLVETAEDFLTSEHIKNICDEFTIKYKPDNLISKEKLDDDSKPKMNIINAWLGKFHFESDFNQKRSELKRNLFENIDINCIRNDYKEFLIGIIKDYLN